MYIRTQRALAVGVSDPKIQRGSVKMCYKDSVQKRNEDKLFAEFEKDKTPLFIRKYLYMLYSKASARNYYIAIKDFLLWLMENNLIAERKISELTPNSFNTLEPADVFIYLEQRQKEGMRRTTLSTRKNILSSFFSKLIASPNSQLEKNPVKTCGYKGKKNNKENIYAKLPDKSQIDAMFEQINWKKDRMVRERNIAILQTLLGSGIRESELAGLEISDLHFEEEIPYITVLGKGYYVEEDKRRVYITGTALSALNKWLEIRQEIDGVKDIDAVFVTKNKTGISADTVIAIFKNYGNGMTPHQIRHYYSTVMAKKTDVEFVAQNLGHKDTETTVGNYVNAAFGIGDLLRTM